MKATLGPHTIADSDDIVDCKGYSYFPAAAVRREWLQKSPKTARDRECPHDVQFYDVTIDGVTHARNAWVYEALRPEMAQVAGRFGFWEDVKVEP